MFGTIIVKHLLRHRVRVVFPRVGPCQFTLGLLCVLVEAALSGWRHGLLWYHLTLKPMCHLSKRPPHLGRGGVLVICIQIPRGLH